MNALILDRHKMDRVSILIPCYNVEKYLAQCLDSILAQSYDNMQIVIIDDGSKDNTWSIIRHCALIDPRIEAYTRENKGVAATRNELLKHVNGDYVLFIDSDDWIEPDMVEFLLKKIKQHGADVVTCNMVINGKTPNTIFHEKSLNKQSAIQLFLLHKELRGSLCNKLIKTNLLHNLSFDPSIGYGEDALFCWQVFQRVNKVVLTDKELYHYRMNQTSISHSSFGKQKLTGHDVWAKISHDTELLYPQFSNIAYARYALEDMYLLRDASQRGYPYDSNIKALQRIVGDYIHKAKEVRLAGMKDMIYAYAIARCYKFGRIYLMLNRVKTFLRSL